jgi:hypothetical protein
MRVHDYERRVLGRTNLDRAMAVWTNLRGADSDFDDLQVALAHHLGWSDPGRLTLPTLLDSTAAVVDAAPWSLLRQVCVEVFFDAYGDTHCYGTDEREWRTADELADDAQFDSHGACRLCALDDGHQAELHHQVASALAVGRVSWDQVCAAVEGPDGG